jgi:O-antigen ligase
MNFYQGRLSGMLIDPNAFGGLVVVALAVHASTFFGERPIIPGWAGLFCTVTLAAGLFLTLSRSAWMGFGLALLFSIPFRPRLIAACLAIGVVALGVLWISLGTGDRSEVLRIANRPETAEQRLTQIRQAIPMIAESPIFGVGIAGFLDAHGWIIHDTTVWMATEFGLVGLGVFLGFMIWFLLRGLSAFRLPGAGDRDLIVGLMCAHVGMWGVSFGIEAFYQRHWWMAMALLASAPVPVVLRRVRRAAPLTMEARS